MQSDFAQSQLSICTEYDVYDKLIQMRTYEIRPSQNLNVALSKQNFGCQIQTPAKMPLNFDKEPSTSKKLYLSLEIVSSQITYHISSPNEISIQKKGASQALNATHKRKP